MDAIDLDFDRSLYSISHKILLVSSKLKYLLESLHQNGVNNVALVLQMEDKLRFATTTFKVRESAWFFCSYTQRKMDAFVK